MRHFSARLLAMIATLGTIFAMAVVVLAPATASAAPYHHKPPHHHKHWHHKPRCHPGYPSQASTYSASTVSKTLVRAGQRSTASMHVASFAGVPAGKVTIRVAGHTYSSKLRGGYATAVLPKLKAKHTYTVTMHYRGHGCWKPCKVKKYVTVFPSATKA